MPLDRPAAATFVIRGPAWIRSGSAVGAYYKALARPARALGGQWIQEWCSRWCIFQSPGKTMTLGSKWIQERCSCWCILQSPGKTRALGSKWLQESLVHITELWQTRAFCDK